ncbi:MAG: FAD-dependent oxidoreductase, partial [Phototrophicaceae bacterium]
MTSHPPKIVVIGAGIGGLTSAALLARAGYDVTVLEAQTYPGGSAGTYFHKGYRFDAGATVAGGFQPNGPHYIAGKLLSIDWDIHRGEPAWVVHLPERQIALTADNTEVLEQFPASRAFWQQQNQLADMGWSLAAQGLPWPPTDAAELSQIMRVGLNNFPADLQIIPYALMSARQWINLAGMGDNPEFVRMIDGQLLISAQTTSQNAYALYSATALDLPRQGVYHAAGGIGGIAESLATRLVELKGCIEYRQHVTRIAIEDGRVTGVYAKHGRRAKEEAFYPADIVIANLTPYSLETLLEDKTPNQLRQENRQRKAGYGAFVLHLGVHDSFFPKDFGDHHQFLMDVDGNLGEGRSLFMS